MIPEALMNLAVEMIGFALGLMPDVETPEWLQPGGTLESATNTMGSYMAPMSVWVPLDHVAIAVEAILACLVTGAAIRSARMVLSLVTGGGGSVS